MKTVMIFGGSGFIGQHIIRRLSKKGYKIIVPFQFKASEAKLRLYGNVGQIIPIKYRNLNNPKISRIINEVDYVINLKTIWLENRHISYRKHILDFNKHLISLIKNSKKNIFYVFFSGIGVNSGSASKRTKCIYEVEKKINEKLDYAAIIRPSIVIGEGDQFLSKLFNIFRISPIIPLFGDGNSKIQPIFVDDVAKSVETILLKKSNKIGVNCYELAGTEIFTYKNLYTFILDCLDLKRSFVSLPYSLMNFLLFFIEKTPFKILTREQLLLFKEDNISKSSNKDMENLGISAKNIRLVIKKIINNR
tara:strand:- start:97 stop:1014 length:918 start_codon:yes stop_codon:yes gene_type:complete